MSPATLLALVLCLTSQLIAQSDSGTSLVRGRTFQIASRLLGAPRTIDVSLPKGYETSPDRRYPVLYVLDGDFEQEMAAATARFYADAGKIPPMIVVGIRNPDRFHELTPALATGFPRPPEASDPGGAETFLGYLADELIPWVERRFRTEPMRVLVGHSLGGLFAAYTLSQRPALFTGYVLMEPSVWWNHGRELRAALDSLRTRTGRHLRVMAVNMEPLRMDTTRWGGDGPMVRELATQGENHTSMALMGMSLSLRTMFADFLPGEWKPGRKPIAMLDRYDSLAFRLGYSVPIPETAYSMVVRMSIDSRYYADAEQVLARMEKTFGPSAQSRSLRDKLARDRANEKPGFVQLEFPSRRPTAAEARQFLGRWVSTEDTQHVIDIRQSGDTIIVHDRELLPSGMPWEGDRPVVQVTADGTLEWGLPVFRGLAALLIQRGKLQPDGTMRVTPEVRGWVPVGPGPDLARTEVFRRMVP